MECFISIFYQIQFTFFLIKIKNIGTMTILISSEFDDKMTIKVKYLAIGREIDPKILKLEILKK